MVTEPCASSLEGSELGGSPFSGPIMQQAAAKMEPSGEGEALRLTASLMGSQFVAPSNSPSRLGFEERKCIEKAAGIGPKLIVQASVA